MPLDIDGLSFEELLELNQRVVARLKMLESMQAHSNRPNHAVIALIAVI
ncbi:MAG: hypothetical protein AB7T01_13095 [Acidithiobacillus sp.]